jgi:hypothetical protein
LSRAAPAAAHGGALGLAEDAVRAIMAAQWPRWRRLQMADDVVWNGGEEARLRGSASGCTKPIAEGRSRPHNPGQPKAGR